MPDALTERELRDRASNLRSDMAKAVAEVSEAGFLPVQTVFVLAAPQYTLLQADARQRGAGTNYGPTLRVSGVAVCLESEVRRSARLVKLPPAGWVLVVIEGRLLAFGTT